MKRCASYVVSSAATYYLTTIHWINESVGMWTETGFRDLESKDRTTDFVLVQHDIWPIEEGHAEMVRLIKSGMTPREIWSREPWIVRGLLLAQL